MAGFDISDEVDQLLAMDGDDLDSILADLAPESSSSSSSDEYDDSDDGSGTDDFRSASGVGWLSDSALDNFPEFEGGSLLGAVTHSHDIPASSCACSSDTPSTLPTDAPYGALPAGWESKVARSGRWFFINHSNRSTSWIDPRTGVASRVPQRGKQAQAVPPRKVQRVQPQSRREVDVAQSTADALPAVPAATHAPTLPFFKVDDAATTALKTGTRNVALERFRKKKRLRLEGPKPALKYKERKVIADRRPRVKGRFVAAVSPAAA
jgi:hypothetical protein